MHNLNEINGKVSFVSAGNKTAWHDLGQILPDDALTAAQCIEHANLDYEVAKQDVYIKVGDTDIVVPNKYATYRTDNNAPFGIVGKDYKIVQNKDAFNFFDNIIQSKDAIYQTAGVLGEGQKMFITAKMPKYIKIAGVDDVTEVYVCLMNSHDGTGAVKAFITPIRIVCQNTLNAAMKHTKNSVSIRHSGNTDFKLKEASQLLGIVNNYVDVMGDVFNKFSKVKISDKVFDELLADIYISGGKDTEKVSTRTQNIRDAVKEVYHTGEGQKEIMGTAWGVYNAFTHYYNHNKDYSNNETKFSAILEGDAYKKQQLAFDKLLTLAN